MFLVGIVLHYFPIRNWMVIDYNYMAIAQASSFFDVFKIMNDAKNLSPLLSIIIFIYFKIIHLSQLQILYFSALNLFGFIFANMFFVARIKNIFYAMVFISILVFTNTVLSEVGIFSAQIFFLILLTLRMNICEKKHILFIEALNVLIISVHFLGIAFYFSQVLINRERKLKQKIFFSLGAILLFTIIYGKLIFSYNVASVSPVLLYTLMHNFASVNQFIIASLCVVLFYSIKTFMYLKNKRTDWDKGTRLFLTIILNIVLGYAVLFLYNPISSQPMRYVHYLYCLLLLQFIFDFSSEIKKVNTTSEFRKIFYVYTFVILFIGLAITNNLRFYNFMYTNYNAAYRLNLQNIKNQLELKNTVNKQNLIIESNSCSGLQNLFTEDKFNIHCLNKNQSHTDKLLNLKNLTTGFIENFYYLDTNNYFQQTSTIDIEVQGYNQFILQNKNFYTLVEYIKK
jgi:hypothetical protein